MWEPFGTQPANATAYWKAAPSERGTFGVLSTCVLTLLLCVYTSLHLNIPRYNITAWYQRPWVLRVFGVSLGLFAPEVVAFLAFRQWLWARNLDEDMMRFLNTLLLPEAKHKSKQHTPNDREHAAEPENGNDDPTTTDHTNSLRRYPWTRVHSHFALMGGFAFDLDDSLAKFIPGHETRLTLTPLALRKLAQVEPMLIPDISERAIKDKSKANWLAKALVCLQACWFIAQVVGRAATSAPISLLEMNTFLHALCCLVIYLAWWRKPLDIEEPELIKSDTELNRKICAWMILNSRLGAYRTLQTKSVERKKGYLVHKRDIYKDSNSGMVTCLDFDDAHLQRPAEPRSEHRAQHQPAPSDTSSTLFTLHPGQSVHGFQLVLKRSSTYLDDVTLVLDSKALECLRLANMLRTDPETENIWKYDWRYSRPTVGGMLLTHISDFDEMDDGGLAHFKGSTTLTRRLDADDFFWITLLFAGSIYGLVHLLAWNGPFTTLTQRWMWRVACFVIASPAVLVAIVLIVDYLYASLKQKTWATVIFAPVWFPCKILRRTFPAGSFQLAIVIVGLTITFGLVYLAARVYLLAECFINMAQLPPEVYQVPQWSQYIPHLGAG